jgi:ribonuclease I
MGGRPDPYCDYDYLFNQKALDKVQNLNTVWPMWGSRMGDSFHEYEWNKHGVCYMKLTKDEFGTRFSEDYIFTTYFEQAIAKAIKHRTVTNHSFQSKEDLAKEIKV